MKSYQCLVFDLDGTLANTAEDIAESANEVLRYFQLPVKPLFEVIPAIGHGVHDLLGKLLPPDICSNGRFEKAVAIFKEHYEKYCVQKTKLYPKVREVLSGPLYPCPKAIVTNKPHHLTEIILDKLQITDYFDPIIGTGRHFPPKPNKDSMVSILNQYGISPDKLLFIGDSKVDAQTAKNAGVDFGWVSYGYDFVDPRDAQWTFSNPQEWEVIRHEHA